MSTKRCWSFITTCERIKVVHFNYLDSIDAKGRNPVDSNLTGKIDCDGMNDEIYNLFYQGKYQEVVSRTLDCQTNTITPHEVPPIVASLTFLGRIDEAKMVFERFQQRLSMLEATMSRFFLGVVNCRHFKFKEARRYFGQNILEARKNKFPENFQQQERIRFYLFQGVGFYR